MLSQYCASNGKSVAANQYCHTILAQYCLPSTGAVLNICDSHYCASNGKSVAANQYWCSTEFFMTVDTIRIGPTGNCWLITNNSSIKFFVEIIIQT